MNEEKFKEYTTVDITVRYYPERCTHSGVCTRNLPSVFDVQKRPWINVNGGSAEEIKKLIDSCPSGALQYR